jgi:single-strand DNA-binding protein
MNVICLMGRVTADIELKTTQNGVSVTSFTLAVDRAYTPKGQEKQTDFINCVAWRNTAEFISKYFRKGSKMAVKGELQQRTYTANDGSKRTVYEVIVDGAFFCEGKNTDSQPSPQFAQAMQGEDVTDIVCDEDLPF